VFRDTTTYDVEIDPDLIRPEDQSTRVGAVTYSLIVDTRPNPIEPTTGFYGTTDIEVATRLLGSNTDFTTLLGRWFGYRSLGDRLTLALGARAGIKIPYADSDSIPLPERFFAGGSTTLRGFRLNGAGPVDDNGNPLGGRVLLISNIELRAQLWGALGGVVFADIGNVFALARTVSWSEVRETLGVGIRYSTPVGPIRFDFARLMDQREGEDRYQVFFSVGHTF
jgi:outer membrane translocation and assembly module TamA